MQDIPDQTQRMLDYYGLAQDPFGERVDATVFSSAGDRSEIAEQLKHLLTFSPQDCLLMAPPGGGKRTLAHQVIKRLEEDWRVAWIDGAEANRLDIASRELIGQLGLGLKADGDTASLYRNMADAIAQRTADGENFLLVIHQADQLPLDVQSWLQSLRTLTARPDTRLRQLWLAGSATAIHQADNDDHWYSLMLEPLSGPEAVTYLRDRFAGAGQLDGIPIEAKDVARLNDLAGGLPGALNQVVSDYLIAGTFKTTERKQGFPLTHVLAGAGVVTLIVVAVLYTSQPEEAASEAAAPTTEEAETEALGGSEVQQRLAEAVARVEARQQDGGADDPALGDTDTAEALEPATPTGEDSDTAQPESAETQPEPASTTEAQAADTTEAATAEPEPAATTGPESPSSGDGLFATAEDSEYTLQLVGVRDRDSVEALLTEMADPAEYDIVESSFEGRPWYVLIHGRYASAEAARADIANLPDAFSDQSPWARTFASLRD